MKILLSTLLALAVSTVPASAITVTTPANGAQVSSPFTLTASTTTCGSVPAVSMGYSIDSGSSVIELTSFTAAVVASPGAHVLHVKCWGHGTNGQTQLNITVGSPTSGPTTITVASPASGAKVTSPFTLAASVGSCSGIAPTSMGYSIDGGAVITQPVTFRVPVTAKLGSHTVRVKCFGLNVQNQVSLTVDVVSPPTAATPQFSLASGTYSQKQVVSLADATPGATVHYTTDGSGPSASSPVYAGPISVASSTVIEALAVAPGYTNSGLGRASYSIVQPSKAVVPPNAIAVNGIQALAGWRAKFDPATNGTAQGSKSMSNSPTLSGQTARYDTSYSNYGGVLYSVTYDSDPNPSNFVYDAEVWISAGSTIGNLEMDNNQVIPNGDTVIYAFQCAGSSNTWEYTENTGTRSNPQVKWLRSTQPCNPATWATNTWHHVQISYSRDSVGNVTYHSVWLDGVEAPINATVMSAFTLGWGNGALVANFQIDGGAVSGSSTLYLDNLTISRW